MLRIKRKRSKDSRSPLSQNLISRRLFWIRKLNSWRRLWRIVPKGKKTCQLSSKIARRNSWLKTKNLLKLLKSNLRIKIDSLTIWRNKFMSLRTKTLSLRWLLRSRRHSSTTNWPLFRKTWANQRRLKLISTASTRAYKRNTSKKLSSSNLPPITTRIWTRREWAYLRVNSRRPRTPSKWVSRPGRRKRLSSNKSSSSSSTNLKTRRRNSRRTDKPTSLCLKVYRAQAESQLSAKKRLKSR